MALRIYGATGRAVEHRELRRLVPERFPCILALKNTGLEIVGGKSCVNGVRRIRGRIESDDEDAFVASFFDRAEHSRGVVRRDQDTLDAGTDQVLDRCDLPLIVAVELAEPGQRASRRASRLQPSQPAATSQSTD